MTNIVDPGEFLSLVPNLLKKTLFTTWHHILRLEAIKTYSQKLKFSCLT